MKILGRFLEWDVFFNVFVCVGFEVAGECLGL